MRDSAAFRGGAERVAVNDVYANLRCSLYLRRDSRVKHVFRGKYATSEQAKGQLHLGISISDPSAYGNACGPSFPLRSKPCRSARLCPLHYKRNRKLKKARFTQDKPFL